MLRNLNGGDTTGTPDKQWKRQYRVPKEQHEARLEDADAGAKREVTAEKETRVEPSRCG